MNMTPEEETKEPKQTLGIAKESTLILGVREGVEPESLRLVHNRHIQTRQSRNDEIRFQRSGDRLSLTSESPSKLSRRLS